MPLHPVQVEVVFGKAVGLADAGARGSYLDQACGEDEALRERVEALLAAHDGPESLLTLHGGGLSTAPC